MTIKEFRELVGKVVGMKIGMVIQAQVAWKNDNHLDQQVYLVIVPTPGQAKKLKALALEFGQLEDKK